MFKIFVIINLENPLYFCLTVLLWRKQFIVSLRAELYAFEICRAYIMGKSPKLIERETYTFMTEALYARNNAKK